jgi:hypothetical protein
VAAKKKKQKAVGVRLPPDVAELFDALVSQARDQVGPMGKVSENQVVVFLIVEEAKRRKIKR